MEPLQAAVTQEQQLRLAALQLRDVVHLAEGADLVDVRVLYSTAARAGAAKGIVTRLGAAQVAALPHLAAAVAAALTRAAAAAGGAEGGPC